MKKRVLSIDFDYFLDTDLSTRNEKFPDGIDEIPLEELDKQWGHFYNTYPEIKDIGVTDKFYTVCRALKRMTRGVVVISNSHKDIWDNVFNLISPEDEIEVTNIDFHHDNYISGGNKVDCANWVRHLMNERPNTELTWIRRSDSEVSSLTGEFPYNHIEDFLFLGHHYDYIFLCFSPEWTPPHLRKAFDEMCRQLRRFSPIYTY